MVGLRKAQESDCGALHQMQVKAFIPMLLKYHDHESSPAAETPDHVLRRFRQPFTDYFWIEHDGEPVGMMRVCDFGESCRLSPICILPEFQGRGYAQQAMLLAEALYPAAKRWNLDTILQEEKLCYLYEKLGYRKTGEVHPVKEGMDLVFYQKGD